ESGRTIRIAIAVIIEIDVRSKSRRIGQIAGGLEDAAQLPPSDDLASCTILSLEIIEVPQPADHNAMRCVGVAGTAFITQQKTVLGLFRIIARIVGNNRSRVR